MRMYGCAALALLVAACGSSSPTTSPTPAQPTLSGHVTAINGGQPLSGLSVAFAAQTATTDASGAFSFTLANTAAGRLTVTGSGILARSVTAAAGSMSVDAIALTGTDAEGYRQIAHNAFDGPLVPLRRWTQAPNVYVRTVAEDGTPISAAQLASTEQVIREAVPAWTDGLFSANVVDGTETREGQAGWITVRWQTLPNHRCGQGDVAVSGGTVDLNQAEGGGCSCNGLAISPRTVRHELGHAMGYWHTADKSDLMWAGTPACDQLPSDRERQYAHILYHRPIGNVDPDTDP